MEKLRYLTDSYDEKIRRINDIGAPFNFVFITDIHSRLIEQALKEAGRPATPANIAFSVDAVDSIAYILERCKGISFIVSGGDIGNDYAYDPKEIRDSYREIMASLFRLPGPVHCCVGNHDDVTGDFRESCRGNKDFASYAVLPDEMHEICMKNNPTKENYYYIDHETADGGYRTVFLNTSDKNYHINPETGLYDNYVEISDKQVDWLKNEALDTERKILVFSHVPVNPAGIYGAGGPPTRFAEENELINGDKVYAILKNCPNVIAQIAGHVHADNVHMDGDLPTVTTLCALLQQMSGKCPPRTIGTYTETAFDVFSVRGDELFATRFGAGEDRTIRLERARRI